MKNKDVELFLVEISGTNEFELMDESRLIEYAKNIVDANIDEEDVVEVHSVTSAKRVISALLEEEIRDNIQDAPDIAGTSVKLLLEEIDLCLESDRALEADDWLSSDIAFLDAPHGIDVNIVDQNVYGCAIDHDCKMFVSRTEIDPETQNRFTNSSDVVLEINVSAQVLKGLGIEFEVEDEQSQSYQLN